MTELQGLISALWGRPFDGWMNHGMVYWGGGWIMIILMLLFWVLVIAALVYFIRWLAAGPGRRSPQRSAEDTAMDILKKRYARGEIDREEFEQKKRDLS